MNYLDLIVMLVYVLIIVGIGLAYSGKQSINDYFLGNRSVPWVLACFSIVATETSTLTFLSIPGLAYVKGFSFLQMTFGYLVGRIVISLVLLPKLYAGNYETAYHYLQTRFGENIRKIMSIIFLITRLLADGVRLFATAIPMSLLTGLSVGESIVIVALITLVYTMYGGVKSVIIVDSIQLVIYIVCALLGIWIISSSLDLSLTQMWHKLPADKFFIFSSGMGNGMQGFFSGYNFPAGLVCGAVFSFASHGIDHLIVQRILCCKDLKSSQKAMIGSGFLVVFQFALFLFLGALLYLYFNAQAFDQSDRIMPEFIVNHLSPGIRGFMLAGVFAAAMSSLSSSINSLSASTVIDIIKLKERGSDNKTQMRISRGISLLWTLVLILFAYLLSNTTTPLVELGLGIAGITYGAMLGIFILAIVKVELRESAVISGIISGIAIVLLLKYHYHLFWIWFVPISSLFTIAVTFVTHKLITLSAKKIV